MSTNVLPLLTKGIDKHYFLDYKTYPTFYNRVFTVSDMEGAYWDDQTWESYEGPTITLPLQTTFQKQILPSFSKRYYAICYTLGDIFPFEYVKDDPYNLLHGLIPARGGAMARAYITNREKLCADYLAITGFTTTSPAPGSPDGDPLFSTSHPMALYDTTSWSNRPSADADLSHSTYNTAYANLVQQMAANNYDIISNRPAKLIYNPTQRAVATQIAQGQWTRDSANFNMNMGVRDNLELIEWPHFRLTGAAAAANSWNGWVILGEQHFLKFMEREGFTSHSDEDYNTRAYCVYTYERFDYGHTDARGTYGSKGG